MNNFSFSEREKEILLDLARKSLEYYLETGRYLEPSGFLERKNLTRIERSNISRCGGVFVTLQKDEQLRGCIGVIISDQPIYETIVEYAVNAGLHDSRFEPVVLDELDAIDFEISILEEAKAIGSIDEIRVGTDGVIMTNRNRRAVFLPQVALEWGWDRIELLEHLSRKAGLESSAYRDRDSSFEVFGAEVFKENRETPRVRKPNFSGSFYPRDREELEKQIDEYLFDDKSLGAETRAIIVPHAGYVYSGKTAGCGYSALKNNRDLGTIVIFAPSHNFYFSGVVYSGHDFFETPLGLVRNDKNLVSKIRETGLENFVREDDFFCEHAIEVQIPFIQKIFDNRVSILPLIVGNPKRGEVLGIMRILWSDESVGFVFSSDMSHYLRRQESIDMDNRTIKFIEKLDNSSLKQEMLCGLNVVEGLIKFAKGKNFRIKNLSRADSGDYSNNDGRVVGYGSFMLVENNS
ncbi:MAG: AmmeMemoRadiSam system protein B [Rickettsiales bacterium]|jgi:AmmeMemoRadiSam system protein B/AmmeMemoRadiSam system protein A|nr:AmmeMemoRadiSam system protein B [Rickettsiales bacterium]